MSLTIQPNESCSKQRQCPYAENCQGAHPRELVFVCDFVGDDGRISEGLFRNANDKTGKMKILVEA